MNINNFDFRTNVNVSIANGQIAIIEKLLIEDQYFKPLFFVDEGFEKCELWQDRVIPNLEKSDVLYNIQIVSGKKEPSYDDLSILLNKSIEIDCDSVIGVGGGSCMDIAKAISVLLTNPGNPIKYRGFDKVEKPGLPLILIPTTSGTGSEASFNASFVDSESKKKLGINGKNMFAKKAILDGEATLSCPSFPLLGSAVDAIVHSLEGYVCNNSNPFADMLAEKSLELMINNIDDVNSSKPDVNKRLKMLQGSFLAGIVQMNSGSGIAAAISYPLSVYYGVPHGIGGGMFTLGVAKWNCNNGFDKYKNLINHLNSDLKTSLDVIEYIQKKFDSLGVPKKLTKFGISKKNLDHLIKIMGTQQLAFDQNPIKFSVENDFQDFIQDYLE
jgi:alcohol dehydrogenase class IV